MDAMPTIKLYGAARCHKTHYYQLLLDDMGLDFEFLDVELDEVHAEALRKLYENRKLHFPTLMIGKKKLRNPSKEVLIKWLDKSISNRNSF